MTTFPSPAIALPAAAGCARERPRRLRHWPAHAPALLLLLIAGAALLGGASRLPSPGGSGSATRQPARLDRAVDGDTLKVQLHGRAERVRVIAPESVKSGTPRECGSEAAARAMRGRAGRPVRRLMLVSDPTQDRRDRYDRLLAYLETPAGTIPRGCRLIRRRGGSRDLVGCPRHAAHLGWETASVVAVAAVLTVPLT